MGRSTRSRFRYARRNLKQRWREHRLDVATDPPVRWLDRDESSTSLLVAFGGLDSAFGMPHFEFLGVTEQTHAKRLFVRDMYSAWYHRGLSGGGIEEVRDRLREEIDACGAERIVMVGNSAGGYAALLFGALLGANVVLSFSPQTTIDLDEMHKLGDRRYDDYLRPLVKSGRLQREWLDLRAVLSEHNGPTCYRVFVDDTFDVDRRHVERLPSGEHIRIYRFGRGEHKLVNKLRKQGALLRLLEQALTSPDAFAQNERKPATPE